MKGAKGEILPRLGVLTRVFLSCQIAAPKKKEDQTQNLWSVDSKKTAGRACLGSRGMDVWLVCDLEQCNTSFLQQQFPIHISVRFSFACDFWKYFSKNWDYTNELIYQFLNKY